MSQRDEDRELLLRNLTLHEARIADAAVAAERERCAQVVQDAREGKRDTDLRSIIYAIRNPERV